jgi:hypothetical protein
MTELLNLSDIRADDAHYRLVRSLPETSPEFKLDEVVDERNFFTFFRYLHDVFRIDVDTEIGPKSLAFSVARYRVNFLETKTTVREFLTGLVEHVLKLPPVSRCIRCKKPTWFDIKCGLCHGLYCVNCSFGRVEDDGIFRCTRTPTCSETPMDIANLIPSIRASQVGEWGTKTETMIACVAHVIDQVRGKGSAVDVAKRFFRDREGERYADNIPSHFVIEKLLKLLDRKRDEFECTTENFSDYRPSATFSTDATVNENPANRILDRSSKFIDRITAVWLRIQTREFRAIFEMVKMKLNMVVDRMNSPIPEDLHAVENALSLVETLVRIGTEVRND